MLRLFDGADADAARCRRFEPRDNDAVGDMLISA